MPAASHCDGYLPNAAFTGANELNGGVVFYRSIQQKLKHQLFQAAISGQTVWFFTVAGEVSRFHFSKGENREIGCFVF